jgi:hypothetical protein
MTSFTPLRPRTQVAPTKVAPFAFGPPSPWLSVVDPVKHGATADWAHGLGIAMITGCHTTVTEGQFIDEALAHLRRLPDIATPPLPDQSVLDQVIEATAQPV